MPDWRWLSRATIYGATGLGGASHSKASFGVEDAAERRLRRQFCTENQICNNKVAFSQEHDQKQPAF
jgi:hypothetical protein